MTNTNDKIQNHLIKNGYSITDFNKPELWKKVYETYKLEKDQEGLEIQGISITSGENIKEWCTLTLSKGINSKNNALYKQASKWCTEYKTIKESFQEGKELITKAKDFKGKYGKLPKSELKNTISKVQVSVTTLANAHKFKIWCEENSNRSYSNDQEFFAKHIKEHCLKDKEKV
ncbi:hypothetical protein A6V39_03890 [Candidatus Mycoplasma haematobovis]|uniref:Uncharacterized protein n=1 Tax=Candidatus Mycoplasma haematobovis TaxID=432608 RepID=A0A1A9QE97_9MOLU|nr:hypothetical protein [Candidatus Mycoplasma haematobovis]OAL10029.1 hypothetical protein A6V39_03890 [Candidatus Mycoplasma haematobovis]